MCVILKKNNPTAPDVSPLGKNSNHEFKKSDLSLENTILRI